MESCKENKKIKSEKELWECFLREVFDKNLISSQGFICKQLLEKEFQKFSKIYGISELATEVNYKTSLWRNGFIASATKETYKINTKKFLESPNDVTKKGSPEIKTTSTLPPKDESKLLKVKNDRVDPKSPTYDLEFLRGNTQYVNERFKLTTTSCCICQKGFSSYSNFDDHLKWHGKDQGFPLEGECENRDAIFKISYKHCVDSYFLHFTIKSTKDVIVEKVVIVRSDLQRSMNYANNEKVPFKIGKGGSESFLVNCFLFNICEQQQFVIIYRLASDAISLRKLEQHIFFRETDFPKCSMKLISTRVPERGQLNLKKQLNPSFPSEQVRNLSKLNYREEEIMKQNNVVGQFILEGKLKSTNFEKVLSFLVQVEDHFILSNYMRLSQKNKEVNQYCNEYSVTITKEEIRGNIRVGEIASAYDDIILSYRKGDNKRIINDDFEDFCDAHVYDPYYSDSEELNDLFGRRNKKKKIFSGFIQKIEGDTIFFELRQRRRLPARPYDIQILPSRISTRYQHNALDKVAENRNIRSLLFPTINFNNTPSTISVELYNKSIEKNPEQLQAVMNIAEGPNGSAPYIIFGPPGTGKTTTVVESTFQLWKMKPESKILITAGSNAACDEVARRLCKILHDVDNQGMNILRIYAATAEDRVDNMEEALLESSNLCHGYHFYPSLESIYLYRIVVVTLTVAGKLVQGKIDNNYFTHIFIDECAASTEPEAMIGIVGLLSSKAKLILSGDPKQLGPVLKCQYAEDMGLGISMMERLLKEKCYEVDPKTGEYDRSIQTRLRRNFRTHPDILCLSNKMYYNNELIPCAGKEITNWALGWHKLPAKKFPIIFHSVNGETKRDVGQTSLRNFAEIEIVMHYVFNLMRAGINGRKIREEDIGIISPYKKQCDIIRGRMDNLRWFQIEVGSVETFQGKEKPIIIVSTVRSNTPGVGFLDNPKRLNVTLTRAQALLIIVGNPRTLQAVSDWRQVINYCQENKAMTGYRFELEKNYEDVDANALPNVPLIFENSSIRNNYQPIPVSPLFNAHNNYPSSKFPGFQPPKHVVKTVQKSAVLANKRNVTETVKTANSIPAKKSETVNISSAKSITNKIAQEKSNTVNMKAPKNPTDAQIHKVTNSVNFLKLNDIDFTRGTSPKKETSHKAVDMGIDTLDISEDVLLPKKDRPFKTEDKYSLDEKKILLQHVFNSSVLEATARVSNDSTNKSFTISENKASDNQILNKITPPPSTGAVKKQTVLSVNNSNQNALPVQTIAACNTQKQQESTQIPKHSIDQHIPTQVVRPIQRDYLKSTPSPKKSAPMGEFVITPRPRGKSYSSFPPKEKFIESGKIKEFSKNTCVIS